MPRRRETRAYQKSVVVTTTNDFGADERFIVAPNMIIKHVDVRQTSSAPGPIRVVIRLVTPGSVSISLKAGTLRGPAGGQIGSYDAIIWEGDLSFVGFPQALDRRPYITVGSQTNSGLSITLDFNVVYEVLL